MFATEVFLPSDPGFSPLAPLQFSDLADDATPLLRDMAPPLVFVEMNLANDAIGIDDTLRLPKTCSCIPAGLLIGLLLPFLIVLFPVEAVSLLIAACASAILSALVAVGFGWFITDVVSPFVVSWIATDQLRIALGSEDTRKEISDLALFTNAGEDLAEEVAQRAIVAAKTGIAAPATDGRDRARPKLFETIVVTQGLARVKMNVSRGFRA